MFFCSLKLPPEIVSVRPETRVTTRVETHQIHLCLPDLWR